MLMIDLITQINYSQSSMICFSNAKHDAQHTCYTSSANITSVRIPYYTCMQNQYPITSQPAEVMQLNQLSTWDVKRGPSDFSEVLPEGYRLQ